MIKVILKERVQLLNEITLDQAKTSLESNATRKQISGKIYDFYKTTWPDTEETLIKDYVKQHTDGIFQKFVKVVLALFPDDVADNEKALATVWLKNRFLETNLSFMYLDEPNMDYTDIVYEINAKFSLNTRLERYFQWKRFIQPAEKQDINKIASINELIQLVNNARPRYEEWQAAQSDKDAEAGSELIYEDDEFKIFIPNNKGAACSLGKGTDWCTAAPGLDYYRTYHKEDDPLFIIFKKNSDPDTAQLGAGIEKFQFHYGTSQFMNARDEQILNFPYGKALFVQIHDILKNTVGERFAFLQDSLKVGDTYAKRTISDELGYIDNIVYNDITNGMLVGSPELPSFNVTDYGDVINFEFDFGPNKIGPSKVTIGVYSRNRSDFSGNNYAGMRRGDIDKLLGKIDHINVKWQVSSTLNSSADVIARDNEIIIKNERNYESYFKDLVSKFKDNPEQYAYKILDAHLPESTRKHFFPKGLESIKKETLKENLIYKRLRLLANIKEK